MKKLLFFTMLSAVGLACLLVACSGNAVEEKAETETVMVSFKDIYSSSKALTVDTEYPDASTFYWMYTAEKKDDGGKEGQKTTVTNLISGKGFGANGDAKAFSVGNWTFTLYGFINDSDRNTVVGDNTKADEYCIYKATTTTDVTFRTGVQTIEMYAWATTTDCGQNLGTLKLGNISTPGSSYTVKYCTKTDSGEYGDWYTSETSTSITTAAAHVKIGMFDSNETILDTKELTVPVYRGLTTTIGGSGSAWEDPTTMISFNVTRPYVVKFMSKYSTVATVMLVKDGEQVNAPEVAAVIQGGTTYQCIGWTTDSDISVTTTNTDFPRTFTTDTSFYAVWKANG